MHLAVAVLIAAPLLYAAASKFLDPSRFASALPRFGLSFLHPGSTSARLVGAVELGVGAALVTLAVALTGIAAGVLYLGFAFLLLRARLRGASGDCGCFGTFSSNIDYASSGRNLILSVGAFGVAYLRSQGWFALYEPGLAATLVVAVTLGAAAADTILTIRNRPA